MGRSPGGNPCPSTRARTAKRSPGIWRRSAGGSRRWHCGDAAGLPPKGAKSLKSSQHAQDARISEREHLEHLVVRTALGGGPSKLESCLEKGRTGAVLSFPFGPKSPM